MSAPPEAPVLPAFLQGGPSPHAGHTVFDYSSPSGITQHPFHHLYLLSTPRPRHFLPSHRVPDSGLSVFYTLPVASQQSLQE